MTMLAATVQVHVSGDPTLDWITLGLAVVTAIMAIATVYLGIQTRQSITVSQSEANATLDLVKETRRDRELGIQPVIVLLREAPYGQVKNIGRGPALKTRIFLFRGDALYWTKRFAASADSKPIDFQFETPRPQLNPQHMPRSAAPSENLWAYCVDQLGNALRFDLRSGDPPAISRPTDDDRPMWADAYDSFL
jgi:hypothetical protein